MGRHPKFKSLFEWDKRQRDKNGITSTLGSIINGGEGNGFLAVRRLQTDRNRSAPDLLHYRNNATVFVTI